MGYEVNKIQSQFEELKSIIISHKNRAYQAVNTELITTYWEVGKFVSKKTKTAEWGTGAVDQLVDYLKKKQPDLIGYNKRSIYRMVKFYETYSSPEFVSAVLSQIKLTDIQEDTIASASLTQFGYEQQVVPFLSLINWTSHLEILTGCKGVEEKIFYILLSYREKLNYRELSRQIESSVYERSLLGEKKQSLKLKETYPTAKQLFKDR